MALCRQAIIYYMNQFVKVHDTICLHWATMSRNKSRESTKSEQVVWNGEKQVAHLHAPTRWWTYNKDKQRVLMHRHQGWNVRHGLCHIYLRYLYIYELFIVLFVLLFVHYCNVMVYVVYCVASGKQEKVQACLVTLWLFIISCHSLYKTTLGSLCSWKPAWSLKKRPHSMCLKPFVKMCIFVVIQIFWSLRNYREQ